MRDNSFETLVTLPDRCLHGGVKKDDYHYIKPGETIHVSFDSSLTGFDKSCGRRCKLRLTGEVDLHPFWRTESCFPLLYRLIDDSLCSSMTHHSPYSLKLHSDGDNYPKRAYYKVLWPPRATPNHYELKGCDENGWKLGVWVKKENVELLSGGRLTFVAEVFEKDNDRHPADVNCIPDQTYTLELGEGTGDWHELSIPLILKPDTGCILIYVAGENFKGTIWLEDPYLLIPNGYNQLNGFMPSTQYYRQLNWVGQNLSRKEWPEFEIVLNNRTVFKGELFERIYRWPVLEIEIPKETLDDGINNLYIKLISSYREALPYKLKKIEFAMRKEPFNIISYPDIVTAGEEFVILAEVGEAGDKAIIECGNSGIKPLVNEVVFQRHGLNFIRFKANEAGPGGEITFKIKDKRHTAAIERIVERQDDHILTGTGDAVYVSQETREMEDFLSWYLHHNIGNCITFRPVYRTCGTRVLNEKVWDKIVKLCNAGRVFYCNMIDGRELPGSSANPRREMLAGEYFIGDQSHEQDGAYNYWGPMQITNAEDELFLDIWSREANRWGIKPLICPIRTGYGTFFYHSPYSASDMSEAALNFVRNVSVINEHAVRHTGPSVLFKYFYQAGMPWLGAELLYGPQEVLLSALRGASRAYGKKDYGAHLSIQWSTTPHDSEQRYRRYFLALFTCYMHGVQHVNTEDGLWRLEEQFTDFERFDEACIKHREIQKRFYRFVKTHSRRGNMHVPIALLHGRFDGWTCFGRGQVWMQNSHEWAFGYPEESWDLIKVFYPLSVLDAIYRHPCPNEPQGFYSGTPYGLADILPVEASTDTFNNYQILAFLGWNTAEASQIEKLLQFVESGGTLLLGWPHLYTSVRRCDALEDHPEVLDNDMVTRLLGAQFNGFRRVDAGKYQGAVAGNIDILSAKPVIINDEGTPLVIENKIGKGRVTFVNIKAYPAEQSVKDLYLQLLKNLGEEVLDAQRDRGWMRCSETVEFSVFDHTQDNLRTIYFLNINWWDEPDIVSSIQLLWGENNFTLDVPGDVLNILTLSKNWAVWTHDDNTDIIDIIEQEDGADIRLQGQGATDITIFHKYCDRYDYDISLSGLSKSEFSEIITNCDGTLRIKFNIDAVGTLKIKICSLMDK